MTIQELREKRAAIKFESDKILKAAHENKQEVLSTEDEQTWQRMIDEVDAIGRHVTMLERSEKLEKELDTPEARTVEATKPGAGDRSSSAAMARWARGQHEADRVLRTWLLAAPTSGYTLTPEDHALAQRSGINLFSKQLEIRFSIDPLRTLGDRKVWEYRAQSVGSPGGGGYTVPDELMRAIEVALLTYGGMREASTVLRTETGAALPIPTTNDTTNKGVILAENTQVANQDVVFAQLDAYKYSSKQVLVSVELLQDNAVNLPALLGRMLGERIGRITNEHFTTGTGTSQPNGIITAATLGYTATTATSQVTAWTYPSIVELEHSVDPAYRRGASFMMSDAALKKTKQIVDTTGRPIWATGMAQGAPDTIMGYPIVINQDMAAMAAGAKSVLFGDLSKYLIRDVLGVTLLRLEERYADYHQVAFLAFARMDGDLLDAGTHPVKYFVNAAT